MVDTSRAFRLGTASSRDLARANRTLVLSRLAGGEQLSRVQIAESTGISPATISRLTPSLVKANLLVEVGSDNQTGGRPSIVFRFDPDARAILVADVDEDVLELAELNLDGVIRKRESFSISHLSPDQRFDELINAIVVRANSRTKENEFVAIGISVPGPVDSTGCVTMAPALGWYDMPLADRLRQSTPVPVLVENDVNLVAYAEYERAGWGAIESLAAIGVFQGVGAGIVENGRLWRGRGGAAGQFGRMLANVSGLKHQPVGFGQLESSLGSDAILERAVAAKVVPEHTERVDDIFRRATKGDEAALSFLGEIADEYAIHLANLCAIVAPDIIVFAGLFERWSTVMIPLLSSRLKTAVLSEPALVPASTGNDGKLVGAGLLAFEMAGGIGSLV